MAEEARRTRELCDALSELASTGGLPEGTVARITAAVVDQCREHAVAIAQVRRRLRQQHNIIEKLRVQFESQNEKLARLEQTRSSNSTIEQRRVSAAGLPRIVPVRRKPSVQETVARGVLAWCNASEEPLSNAAQSSRPKKASKRMKPERSARNCATGTRPDERAASVSLVERALRGDSALPSHSQKPPVPPPPGLPAGKLSKQLGVHPIAPKSSSDLEHGNPNRLASGRAASHSVPVVRCDTPDVVSVSSGASGSSKLGGSDVETGPHAGPESFAAHSDKSRSSGAAAKKHQTGENAGLRPLPSLFEVVEEARRRRQLLRDKKRSRDRDRRLPCAECCTAQRKKLTSARGTINEKVYARFMARPGACHHFRHLDEPLDHADRDGWHDVSFPETETQSPAVELGEESTKRRKLN